MDITSTLCSHETLLNMWEIILLQGGSVHIVEYRLQVPAVQKRNLAPCWDECSWRRDLSRDEHFGAKRMIRHEEVPTIYTD